MKRRTFVSGAGGLITGYIVSASHAHAQSAAIIQMSRSSRLFGSPTSTDTVPRRPRDKMSAWQLQDLFTSQEVLYFLYRNFETHNYYVGSADALGNALWTQPLPKAEYFGMGLNSTDSSLLLHASGFQGIRSSIARFSPQSGEVTLVTPLPSGAELHFAGDSKLARFTSHGVELWAVDGASPRSIGVELGTLAGLAAHMQALPNGDLAVVSKDARYVVTLQKGTLVGNVHAVVSDDISNSIQYYSKYAQRPELNPAIVMGTGLVGTSSSLAVLISPFVNKVARVVVFDSAIEKVVSTMSLALPPLGALTFSVPYKIVSNGSGETGIVFANGSIAWYPS